MSHRANKQVQLTKFENYRVHNKRETIALNETEILQQNGINCFKSDLFEKINSALLTEMKESNVDLVCRSEFQ